MTRHEEFSQATGVPVFFCDAYSPWQRGSNENTNGLLRQYFPKKTHLSLTSAEQLLAAVDEFQPPTPPSPRMADSARGLLASRRCADRMNHRRHGSVFTCRRHGITAARLRIERPCPSGGLALGVLQPLAIGPQPGFRASSVRLCAARSTAASRRRGW
jgi:hypothetical protein